MTYSINQSIYGFRVQNIRHNSSLNGNFVEMVHEKTGAELCWLDNKEENKLFCIGFKTVPEDDSGVFHILEHSVLCGSDQYPVREPFVELLKGSMNTFLNAMTYPDKTIYPVSSRNQQDFMNLTKVYLDAVFAPALLHDPNIFYQEGIHIELEDEPSYVGVVFSEMKGAMSSVDEIMELGLAKLLFPDSCYQYNSGGDPKAIPDLTYAQFVETYKRFYHPSNSRIYLDGDIPLGETLSLIDSYLSRYEKKELDFSIAVQKPTVAFAKNQYEYLETPDSEDYLSFAKIVGSFDDPTKLAKLTILCSYLSDSNESPFCKTILSKKLAKSLNLYISDSIQQPYMVLTLRHTSVQDKVAIQQALSNVVSDLLQNGIPKEDLLAECNKLEFDSRQTSEPQGLYRATSAYQSWLYGGDPLLYLDTDTIFAPLRDAISDGEFDVLLKELFHNWDSWSTLFTSPSNKLGLENEKSEQDRVHDIVSSLTEDELTALKKENESLANWQQTPDTKQQLATIPSLPLSAVDVMPSLTPTKEMKTDFGPMYFHKQPTNGVSCYVLYFNMAHLSLEEIARFSIVCHILSELPTKDHSVMELQRLIKTYIGSLSIGIVESPIYENPKQASVQLMAGFSSLNQNIPPSIEILVEILTKIDFSRKDLIQDLLIQIDNGQKQMLVNSGHAVATTISNSHYSAAAAVALSTRGYIFAKTVRQLVNHFDDEIDSFISFATTTLREIVNQDNVLVSLTSEEPRDVSIIHQLLPKGEKLAGISSYVSGLPKKCALIAPSQVTFAGCSYSLKEIAKPMNGSLSVLCNILSLSHFWNRVRVQGGAYGAGIQSGMTGGITQYTYRDPSPLNAIEATKDCSSFIRDFVDSDEEDLEKFIISQLAAGDPLTTPIVRGLAEDRRIFSHITSDIRIAMRKQMLSMTKKSLLDWCDIFDAMANDGAYCVVGNKSSIQGIEGLTTIEI